jgi:hypothetical protein
MQKILLIGQTLFFNNFILVLITYILYCVNTITCAINSIITNYLNFIKCILRNVFLNKYTGLKKHHIHNYIIFLLQGLYQDNYNKIKGKIS